MNYNCLKARCIKNQLGIYKKGLQSAHIKKKKNSDPSITLTVGYALHSRAAAVKIEGEYCYN